MVERGYASFSPIVFVALKRRGLGGDLKAWDDSVREVIAFFEQQLKKSVN